MSTVDKLANGSHKDSRLAHTASNSANFSEYCLFMLYPMDHGSASATCINKDASKK